MSAPFRRCEAGRHVHQCAKGANHQSGANQQNQRQRHLHNHQGLACAVPFAALAQRAATFAQAGFHAVPGVFDRPE